MAKSVDSATFAAGMWRVSHIILAPVHLLRASLFMVKNLWENRSADIWSDALKLYVDVIESQGVRRLPELDRWVHDDFPKAVASRHPGYLTLDELVKITEWKMARGVWRARNLVLVRGNAPEEVRRVSTEAFASVPDPTAPVKSLSTLAGVGPATASAVVAASHPTDYPFFDELVAAQIPGADAVTFNLKYYAWYAEALRGRATELGDNWTAALVEQALWANSGGKIGLPHGA